MLKLNIVVVLAILTLAVALVACGQGVEPTPEPTPTLIPMSRLDAVIIAVNCTGLEDDSIDQEKLRSLSAVLGLVPVEPNHGHLTHTQGC